jgi:DNA replication protein DnaC
MARCLANACIDHCYVVAEITGIELDAISKRFDWLDRLDDFAQVPVLLLDDLDKARWSEDGITALWWLIDQRWDNHRRTIISANWDPERFIEAITKARPDNATLAGTLMDRLSWTNKPCKRIQLRGASLRQGLPK